LALRAVAASAGAAFNYDDLCAALGISFTTVSTSAEPSPAHWLTYGRDLFIEPVGRMFGFALRDLHPPDIGVDMLAAEEFPQHFELSYKPLIRRALENRQPVLAWRGWEGDFARDWGVITGTKGDDFIGAVPNAQLTHTAPAMQCYVVERFEPR